MAIQIRRGANSGWESNNSNIVVGEPAITTDSERFFVGTASGSFAEFANINAIAPTYNTTTQYYVGDYVFYQGKMYVCVENTSGAWSATKWLQTSIGQAMAENLYANYEATSVSGDIVSFDNGAGDIPVKDLKVSVDAVQDLHGYDYPWVGGAGKNLLAYTLSGIKSLNTAGTWSGNAYTRNNITFTVQTDLSGNVTSIKVNSSGSASANTTFIIGHTTLTSGTDYILSGGVDDSARLQLTDYPVTGSKGYDTGSGLSFTADSTDYAVRIYTYSGSSYTDTLFYPMIRVSTESATFEPSSNISPITGWSSVNVNDSVNGNTLDFLDFQNGYFLTDNGTVSPSANFKLSGWIALSQLDRHYYFTITSLLNSNSQRIRIHEYDGNKNWLRQKANPSLTYNTAVSKDNSFSSDAVFVRFSLPINLSADSFFVISDDNWNGTVGQGRRYTTALGSTYYGGSLDVTTGVLTLTHGAKIFDGTETWGVEHTANFYSSSGRGASSTAYYGDKLRCSVCKSTVASATGTTPNCYISTTGNLNIQLPSSVVAHTGTDMKNWCASLYANGTPLSICYELTTPTTATLTPLQVRTLLHKNNIWADCGVVNVTYRISNV